MPCRIPPDVPDTFPRVAGHGFTGCEDGHIMTLRLKNGNKCPPNEPGSSADEDIHEINNR